MQAAIFHGDKNITIGEAPMPVPGAGEALLRVKRTALCGSDTKLWFKGATVTPGHEIFGVVEQTGHPLHGRRCLVYIPVHCGHCEPAARATRRCASTNRCWSAGTAPAAMPNTSRCPTSASCLCPTTSRTNSRRCCWTPSAPRRTAFAS